MGQNPNHPCSQMPRLYCMNKYQADCLSGSDIMVSVLGTKAHTVTPQHTPPPPPPPPPPQPQNSQGNECIWKSVVHPAVMKYRHHYTSHSYWKGHDLTNLSLFKQNSLILCTAVWASIMALLSVRIHKKLRGLSPRANFIHTYKHKSSVLWHTHCYHTT